MPEVAIIILFGLQALALVSLVGSLVTDAGRLCTGIPIWLHGCRTTLAYIDCGTEGLGLLWIMLKMWTAEALIRVCIDQDMRPVPDLAATAAA